MSLSVSDFFGTKTTPSARIASTIVSLLIVALLFFENIQGIWIKYAYAFLGLHLINHLIVGIEDRKMPVCPDCNANLKYKMKVEKHVCKKKKVKK